MAAKKGIVIICNLDTRGEDIIFVKDLIEGRGHDAILLDFSMEEPPPFAGDIPCEEVARRVAYVPQSHAPPFPFEVLDIVLMGRTARLGRFSSPGAADRASEPAPATVPPGCQGSQTCTARPLTPPTRFPGFHARSS